MLKKAIGFLAAASLALTSLPAAAFAEEGTVQEIVSQTDFDTPISEEEVEEFALETFDPEYGKYAAAQAQTYSDRGVLAAYANEGGITETDKFTGMDITHNPRFNDYNRFYGIDVSMWQYNIDWQKVKEDGVDFAIIRLGYRGYGKAGDLVLDPYFKQNMAGAAAAGIDIGIYFYTQAINNAEAKAEADFVLKYLKGYDIQLPIYFDIESVDNDVGRLDSAGLTKKQKTELCTSFCDRIIENGYEAGVYGNKYWFNNMIDGRALATMYPIWLAHYTSSTDYDGTYSTWQFSSVAKVSGIATNVDINVDYREKGAQTPVDVAISAVNGQAVIAWIDESNADEFEIYSVDTYNDVYTKLAIVKSESYAAPLDVPGAYCVKAIKYLANGVSYSDYSDIVYVNDSLANTLTPAKVARTEYTSATVYFGGVNNASLYRVTDTRRNKVLAEFSPSAAGRYQTVEGFQPSGWTYLLIQAVKLDGTTEDIGYMYTEMKQLAAPANVMIGTRSSDTSAYTTAQVSWNPVAGAEGYCIYEIKNGTEYYAQRTTKTDETVYSLKAGSNFEFVVKPYIERDGVLYFGSSSQANVIRCRPQTPIVTVNGADISFNRTEGAQGYIIYRSESLNGSYTRIAKLDGAAATFYTDTTAASDTTYFYKVRAYRNYGSTTFYSEYSAAKSN